MANFLETLKGLLQKGNALLGKLPFKGLAEKLIPAGARTKVPLLEKIVIPFANQIVVGLAVLLLITAISPSGGLNLEYHTQWEDSRGYIINLGAYPADPTFFAFFAQISGGTFKISGNKLTLTYSDDNSTEEFKITRNAITNSNGIVFSRDKEVDKRARQPAPAQVTSGGGSSQQQSSSQQNQPVQIARVTLTTGESTEQSAEWLGSNRNHAIRRIEGDRFYVEYYDNTMRNPNIWKRIYRVSRNSGIGSSLTISDIGNWN